MEVSHGGGDQPFLLSKALEDKDRSVDQPIAEALTDLHPRGLLKDTLVMRSGEFGPIAHQKPKNWTGYRCEIQVGLDRSTGKYIVTAQFLDGLSNRAMNLESRNILDLLGCLHEAYRKFDIELEWRKVSLSHFWDETEKRWCDRTAWEYGQLILEPGGGDNGLN